jgi:hypothetical protein
MQLLLLMFLTGFICFLTTFFVTIKGFHRTAEANCILFSKTHQVSVTSSDGLRVMVTLADSSAVTASSTWQGSVGMTLILNLKNARFQAPAAKQTRPGLFWVITQRVVAISY